MLGGCCKDCGYNASIIALQFDHLDASQKSYNLGELIGNSYSMEVIIEEAKKCEVVCANCHAIRTHNRRPIKHIKS